MSWPRSIARVGGKRRWAGWALLSMGVLAAAVWGMSRWWMLESVRQTCAVRVRSGYLFVEVFDEELARAKAVRFEPVEPRVELVKSSVEDRVWRWWISRPPSSTVYCGVLCVFTPNGKDRSVLLVLWPLPVLLCVPGMVLVRLGVAARRRAEGGGCVTCGYSRAGLGEGTACPECGTEGGAT